MPSTFTTRDAVSSKIAQQRRQNTVRALGIAENFIDERWLFNDNSLENIDTEQNPLIIGRRAE